MLLIALTLRLAGEVLRVVKVTQLSQLSGRLPIHAQLGQGQHVVSGDGQRGGKVRGSEGPVAVKVRGACRREFIGALAGTIVTTTMEVGIFSAG